MRRVISDASSHCLVLADGKGEDCIMKPNDVYPFPLEYMHRPEVQKCTQILTSLIFTQPKTSFHVVCHQKSK